MRHEEVGLAARVYLRTTGATIHRVAGAVHCYRLWLELAKLDHDAEADRMVDECERVLRKFIATGELEETCQPPPRAA